MIFVVCLLFTIFVLFLMIIFFMGDPYEQGILSKLYIICFRSFPKLFRNSTQIIFGKRGPQTVDRVYHYIVNTNNCLVQLFYLFIMFSCYWAFVIKCHPLIPSPRVPNWVIGLVFMLEIVCFTLYGLASGLNPGIIGRDNVSAIQKAFPYDKYLYRSGRSCSTCKIPKPARSKHCALCNHCVSRFDHHCIWLANCVGEGNQPWFLSYLVVQTILISMGSIIPFLLLQDEMDRDSVWSAKFQDSITGELFEPSYWMIYMYYLGKHTVLVALQHITTILTLVVGGFTVYHFYMASKNITSNDKYKSSKAKHNLLVRTIREARLAYLMEAGPRAEDDIREGSWSFSDVEEEEEDDEEFKIILTKAKTQKTKLRGNKRRDAALSYMQNASSQVDLIEADNTIGNVPWNKGFVGNFRELFGGIYGNGKRAFEQNMLIDPGSQCGLNILSPEEDVHQSAPPPSIIKKKK